MPIAAEDKDSTYDVYKRLPDGSYSLVSRGTEGGIGPCGLGGDSPIALSADGRTAIFETAEGLALHISTNGLLRGDEDTAALRASYIHLGAADAGAPNATRGRIQRRLFHGDFIEYVVTWPSGQLIVRRPPTEILAEDDEVTIWFAPEHCVLLQG